MDVQRRAALALHGLQDSDRDWILGQLPGTARTRLNGLLTELGTLGIPADPTLAAAATREAAPAPTAAVAPSATPLDRIGAATPALVCAALAGESDEVIAACFGLEAWAWRNAALARWPRDRRARIVAAIHRQAGTQAAPKRREALLAAFDARLAVAAPGVSAMDIARASISRIAAASRTGWSHTGGRWFRR
jgi:hypothetical protein